MNRKLQSILLSAILIPAALLFPATSSNAQQNDTLRIMVYNTLDFGPGGCQTPGLGQVGSIYHYLREVIQYGNPDIIGLDKMQCIKTSPSDVNGLSSPYFPDTVASECLNAVYPGRYSWCPFTDLSRCTGGNSSILFYDQNKLGYVSTTVMSSGQEDIDMHKLYYKQWFGSSPDTTFLYVILCHTISNDNNSIGRDGQDSSVINNLKAMFPHTPNMIYMGDFNTHSSTEPGYEYITQTSDTNFVFDDPPFHPDSYLTYPNVWHSGNSAQAWFTTTTRQTTLPNTCGTTGGAKDWYDHILLSPWIVEGIDNLKYVKNSYKTIGNNGNRAGIDANDSPTHGYNTSAPQNVLDAIYNFSDKYPLEVTLAVNPILSVKNIQANPGSIKVNNPAENDLVMHFASYLIGQNITISVFDICGRNLYQSEINIASSTITRNIVLVPGVYFIHFTNNGCSITLKVVKD